MCSTDINYFDKLNDDEIQVCVTNVDIKMMCKFGEIKTRILDEYTREELFQKNVYFPFENEGKKTKFEIERNFLNG